MMAIYIISTLGFVGCPRILRSAPHKLLQISHFRDSKARLFQSRQLCLMNWIAIKQKYSYIKFSPTTASYVRVLRVAYLQCNEVAAMRPSRLLLWIPLPSTTQLRSTRLVEEAKRRRRRKGYEAEAKLIMQCVCVCVCMRVCVSGVHSSWTRGVLHWAGTIFLPFQKRTRRRWGWKLD